MKIFKFTLYIILTFLMCSCIKEDENILGPTTDYNNRIIFISDGNIFTVYPDGSDLIKMASDTNYSYNFAKLSPNQRYIAVCSYPVPYWPDIPPSIYILDNNGNNLKSRVYGARRFVWSPNSDKIVYEKQSWGPTGELYMINIDGTNDKKIEVADSNITHLLIGDWSKNGERLLVSARIYEENTDPQYSYELYEMDIRGNFIEQITNTQDMNELYAIWSPDESEILFSTTGYYRHVYIMNADGSDIKRITPDGEHRNRGYCWSSDGSKIAFDLQNKGDDFSDIYITAIESLDLSRITFNDSTNMIKTVVQWR